MPLITYKTAYPNTLTPYGAEAPIPSDGSYSKAFQFSEPIGLESFRPAFSISGITEGAIVDIYFYNPSAGSWTLFSEDLLPLADPALLQDLDPLQDPSPTGDSLPLVTDFFISVTNGPPMGTLIFEIDMELADFVSGNMVIPLNGDNPLDNDNPDNSDYTPTTATLTWQTMSNEAPTPTDLDGDGRIDLNMMNSGLEATVTFSKPVSGFGVGNLETMGFQSTLASPSDLAQPASVFTFHLSPYMPIDDFSGYIGFGNMGSVQDVEGNVIDTGTLPQTINFDGDTLAPANNSYSPFFNSSSLSDNGLVGVKSDLINHGEAFRFYSDGVDDGNYSAESGFFVGQSDFSDGTALTTMALTEAMTDSTELFYTVVDTAGNESMMSTNRVHLESNEVPTLVGIHAVNVHPEYDTVIPADEAYFIVDFSENMNYSGGEFIDSFVVSGLSDTSMITVTTTALEHDPYDPDDMMSYGHTTFGVNFGGLGVGDIPLISLKPTLDIESYEFSQYRPEGLVYGPDAGEVLGWVTLQLSGDATAPVGEQPAHSTNLNFHALDLNASPGGEYNFTQSFNNFYVDTVDASIVYASTSSPYYMGSTTAGGSSGTDDLPTYDMAWDSVGDFSGGLFGNQIYSADSGMRVSSDPGFNDSYALVGDEDPAVVITPETGEKGLDTIDLSALNGSVVISSESGAIIYTAAGQSSVTTVFDTSGFEGYVLTDNGVNDFIGSHLSEIVYVGNGGDNVLRAGNRSSGDDAPETDIVSYASTDAAIHIDLGTHASRDTVVTREGVADDVISGFEGVIGSTGNDTITGSGIGNYLAGADGDDIISGEAGDDILYGGIGADTLYGGAGSDMLIDLDGAILQGSESLDRAPSDATEQDIFVVREGATIKNFHLSGDGTGLAGRSTSANDAIVFSISAAALFEAGVDLTDFFVAGNPDNELLDGEGFFRYVNSNLVFNTPSDDGLGGQDLIVEFKDGGNIFEVGNVKLEGLTALLQPAGEGEQSYGAGVVQLDWLTQAFNTNQEGFNSKIDMQAVYEAGGKGDSSLNFAVALEAVRAGTVRGADANGVMAGDQSLNERIYNPGFGDELIIGGKTNDRYEFVVQTFEDQSGNESGNAGSDEVFDIDGYDVLSFSDIALNQLQFEAVKVGREAGNNSLRVSYEQTDINGTTNSGDITWQGHFSEGGRLAAEALELGPASNATQYALAATRYDYDENGYVLGGAKITSDDTEEFGVTADVIMVGQYNSGAAVDNFVFKTEDHISSDGSQEAHMWNVNAGDIIDISDYVTDFGTATLGNMTFAGGAEQNSLDSSRVDVTFGGGALTLSLTMYDFGGSLSLVDEELTLMSSAA